MLDFSDPEHQQKYHQRYVLGEGVEYRYEAFIEEVLGVELADAQRAIVRSVEDNPKTAVVSGNGFGKSFTSACLGLAWMYCNDNAFGLITGGNNAQLKDGLWDDLDTLQDSLKDMGFPGRVTNSNQDSQLKFDGRPNHKMRCLSARNAGSLEGKHQGRSLVIIEEANKPTIDRETIRSAVSTVTDDKDRVLIIGNPPERGHPFDKILRSTRYEKLHFSAFHSRNVRRALGETDEPEIDGIITPYRIKDIWQDSHPHEPYPGLYRARWLTAELPLLDGTDTISVRSDLHEDWYRLVQGETPPSDASKTRPFYESQVETATSRWSPLAEQRNEWSAIGVDLASSGGDYTVAVGVSPTRCEVLYEVEGAGADENKRILSACESLTDDLVVDAIGNENFLDEINTRVTKFKGSLKAQDEEAYYNRRTESYFELGKWFEDGGTVQPGTELSKQLFQVSRVADAERKSRKTFDNWFVTKKEDIKTMIDADSPDHVDALAQAVWGLRAGTRGDLVDTSLTQRSLFG